MGDVTAYIDQFGYIVLFTALLLELLALPLPGEVLMSYTGFLVYKGDLNWILSIGIAGTGSCLGMTISYWIGYKLGKPFFGKYGYRVHLGPKRLENTSLWFSKYGNKLLVIAFFIPGIRHITGYFSGITRLPYKTYAIFAYTGAFLWVTVFISLGKILGPQWEMFHSSIKKYLIIGGIAIAIISIVYFLYKKNKALIIESTTKLLNITLTIFQTKRKVAFLLALTLILTLGLIILMIGMIEDFLSNEFTTFNQVVGMLMPLIFNQNWSEAMHIFSLMGSRIVLCIVIIFTLFLILLKGQNKLMELSSFLIVLVGGELYEEGLRTIFQNHFPNEQTLMNFIIYGFASYIVVRSVEGRWIHTFVPVTGLVVLILIAISHLYFNDELPSDITAGFVFGGVWLGLNILLLEICRLLRSIDRHQANTK
ncbi:VTT domain-containing protein [Lysinibacillus sp. fls2-241-R2A-57]|uniref:VTT domain-containing protein n=1 Tax=Lysinibacillus sp. fls2-241-R2A-57 TaxID=3040292 RepID=UPI002552497B|nr:VTT domain-containing protein [Lysinibacillus sp. fls2-241-R2A-57]